MGRPAAARRRANSALLVMMAEACGRDWVMIFRRMGWDKY